MTWLPACLAAALLVLLLAVFLRTLRFGAPAGPLPRAADDAEIAAGAAERLAGALRFPTLSHLDPGPAEIDPFERMQADLADAFPAVHTVLQLERVGSLGLLFTWPGREPELKPVLLMAHQDVVPVSEATLEEWTHPPFGGTIAGGFIWGRGALDDKASLIGLLEATEGLLKEGFRPRRTVYLACGHDEETGGENGSARIAELLRRRGVRLAWVLDEGGMVTEGLIPGVTAPVALVGIAEKGFVTLELTANGEGGHSSLPRRPTTIGILSRALDRLENRPFPADLTLSRPFFAALGPALPFSRRLLLANLWLFGPLVKRALARSPELNALIRTTVAPTMLAAGIQENVLPDRASAIVNLRILPGASVAGTLERIEATIADARVTVRAREVCGEPLPMPAVDDPGYRLIEKTIRQTAKQPELRVAPFLETGATDSRHYRGLADAIYRFAFLRLGAGDLQRLHGVDERISTANYLELIRFYTLLLKNLEKDED
jgi:carboxypeptidase PM20D1